MSQEPKKEPSKEEMEKEFQIVTLKKIRWKNAMLDTAWTLEAKRNCGREYTR
jgi:thymidylate synthase